MNFFLFFILLLNKSSTVITVTGFNDKVVLQPMSSSGLILRKVPKTLPSIIQMPPGRRWPNIVFLKNLFELECLREIYGRGRLKTRPRSPRPDSFVPGPEGPAYKTVNKNQGNNYDKIPDTYRPSTSFEHGKRYFGGNVRVVSMPVPYRSNMNGHHRYKPDVSQQGIKVIKDSSPPSSHRDSTNDVEKLKQEVIPKESQKTTPAHYSTTSQSTTITTTRSSIGGSVNKPIKFHPAEVTDEHVIPFNNLIKDKSRLPTLNKGKFPMMASYGDAKTFSKFSHFLNRIKPTTASYPEHTSSNILWYDSKPRPPNHSYEVEEIIEEDIRFALDEKKERNHMTKKPPGGRQFKFDGNAYEGFKIGVPNMMKPANNGVINSSINTILSSLINPVTRITDTEGMTPDKSNNSIITSPPALQNSSFLPKTDNSSKAKQTSSTLPLLLPHASTKSSLPQEDQSQDGSIANQNDVSSHIPPHPYNNYLNFFRAPTTEKAHPEKQDHFPPRQSISLQNLQNREPHPASTRTHDKIPLPALFQKEPQKIINFKNLPEMRQKTDDGLPRLFPVVTPNDLHLPEVFKELTHGFSEPDKIFSPTPKVVLSEETKMPSTFPLIPYNQPKNRLDQSTTPPKSSQEVLFTSHYLPEAYNYSDFPILSNLAERKEQIPLQQLFTFVPLTELMVENQSTETEPTEKDERTDSPTALFEIQTEFGVPETSESKPKTETNQSILFLVKLPDDQQFISESVAITSISHPEGGKSSSPTLSPSMWVTVSENDDQYTTEKSHFEEDNNAKTTTLTDVSMTIDLLNTSKKDSSQESNWKNSRKMHFNQEPTKLISDNQIMDNTAVGQRRSDILINDTLDDYVENQNQISSLNYLESIKENSSHLNPGSLIQIAPDSIIPIIPQIINDLRDERLSEENFKVLSHAFGKYWPYIQALSENANLDMLPLMKMKDEKDLEGILTSFVLEEPKTTTVKQQGDENFLDYGRAYDYLEDYKEMYKDILNQELGKENDIKIRFKRDEEDDLKTLEATHEYFESIAKERNEEGSEYIYEDVMYDNIQDDESDSSIFELMEMADVQFYVRNVTL